MSNQSFASVANKTIDQYSVVGKVIAGTYLSGAVRLANAASTRYASFLNGRNLPLLSDAVKASLIESQQQAAGAVVNGINVAIGRAEQVIDLTKSSLNSGIARATKVTGRVEAAFDTQAISKVAQLTMPAAQISLEIANRAVDGTKRLSARLSGVTAPHVASSTIAKTVTRAKRRA